MSCDKGKEEMRQIVEKITDKPVVVLLTSDPRCRIQSAPCDERKSSVVKVRLAL